MKETQFTVPGLPVAQPRQRHAVRKSRTGKAFVQNYTPKSDPVNAFKAAARMAASQAHCGGAMTGPLLMDVEFVFPRPGVMVWKKKPMPRVRHTKKPDRDNLEKALMDALKGIVWIDDAQVCDGSIRKWIAAGDEQPGVHVVIRQLEDVAT